MANAESFMVEYTLNNVECVREIFATDLKAAKKQAREWRKERLRFRSDELKITAVTAI